MNNNNNNNNPTSNITNNNEAEKINNEPPFIQEAVAICIDRSGSMGTAFEETQAEYDQNTSFVDKYFIRPSSRTTINFQGERTSTSNQTGINTRSINFIESDSKIENSKMIIVNNVRLPGVIDL